MPLSEEEQRLLEQMEQALAAEDPKFASTLRGSTLRARLRRQVVLSAVAFLAGTGLLMLGVILTVTLVSVAGFVLMLGAAYLFITAWRRGGEVTAEQDRPAGPARAAPDEGRRTRLVHGPDGGALASSPRRRSLTLVG